MKKLFLTLSLLAMFLAVLGNALGAETNHFEYATIRWAGRDNTHVIRPGGKVEFVGMEIKKIKKPDRADERSFYMNLVVNELAKEGYEVAAMTNDEILMKRPAQK